MSKKGQSSVEYLSTFMWTFIGMVVVVGALSYTGIFDSSKYKPENCNSGTQIACEDAFLTSQGELHVMIKNNLEVGITLVRGQTIDPEGEMQTLNIDVEPGKKATVILETNNEYESKKATVSYKIIYKKYSSSTNTPEHTIVGKTTARVVEISDTATATESTGDVCGDGKVTGNEECDYNHINCEDTSKYCNSECKCEDLSDSCGFASDQLDIGEECDVGFECSNPTQTCYHCKCLDYDDNEELCTSKGYDWNDNSCCGDDVRENFITRDCGDSSTCISTESDTACCPEENNCVYEGECYSNKEITTNNNDERMWCNNGVWELNDDNAKCQECYNIGCDDYPDACAEGSEECGQDFEYEWLNNSFGSELGNPGCCGDDSNEFVITCQEEGNLHMCDSNYVNKACCSQETDCVYNGLCYSKGQSGKSIGGNFIICSDDNSWKLKESTPIGGSTGGGGGVAD